MEEMIYDYLLKNHAGYDNRIKGKELMKIFGIKDHKTLRSYIEKARQYKEYRYLIGSEAGSNGGYFMITNGMEKEQTINHIRLRAEEQLKTCDFMEKKEIYES